MPNRPPSCSKRSTSWSRCNRIAEDRSLTTSRLRVESRVNGERVVFVSPSPRMTSSISAFSRRLRSSFLSTSTRLESAADSSHLSVWAEDCGLH